MTPKSICEDIGKNLKNSKPIEHLRQQYGGMHEWPIEASIAYICLGISAFRHCECSIEKIPADRLRDVVVDAWKSASDVAREVDNAD